MKANEKDVALADLYAHRKKENDLRKVEKEFQLKLRLDKVGQFHTFVVLYYVLLILLTDVGHKVSYILPAF